MVNIIQGGIKKFTVLLTKLSDGEPLDLSTVTEITTCLLNTDGTELMLSLTGGDITVLNAAIGKIQIELSDAETADLAVVDSETLELAVDLGDGPLKSQISNAYSVIQTIC